MKKDESKSSEKKFIFQKEKKKTKTKNDNVKNEPLDLMSIPGFGFYFMFSNEFSKMGTKTRNNNVTHGPLDWIGKRYI